MERLLVKKERCLRASKQDNSELCARLAEFASSMDVANNLLSSLASQLAQCREPISALDLKLAQMQEQVTAAESAPCLLEG